MALMAVNVKEVFTYNKTKPSFSSYITYNFYLFRTRIYADLRGKLFPQLIKCLTFNFRFRAKINQKTITPFIINSIEDSNNLLRQFLIVKILIICVHLRPYFIFSRSAAKSFRSR
jgi:hypothetical protein